MRMLPADNPEDDVALTLRTIPLDEAENVPFEALSYVWGSPDHSSKVLVHGSGTNIPTTPNLIQALKSLRSDVVVEPPWMWIDAICVNQQDLDERSQQVQYMATIYSKAAKVVAWVGPPTCDSDIALNYFEDINRHVSFDYENFEFHAKTSDLSWTKPQYIEDVQSAAIISFFQRSCRCHLAFSTTTDISKGSQDYGSGRRFFSDPTGPSYDAVVQLYLGCIFVSRYHIFMQLTVQILVCRSS